MEIRDVQRGLFFLARESGEAMRNDPALALRLSATALQGTLMSGVTNDSVKLGMSNTIVPAMRGALLAMNTARCIQTFKDPLSKPREKVADVVRVGTDIVGFAGGMAMLFLPQYATVGATMVGVSYAADLISHAYRGLEHADRRLKYWQNIQDNLEPNPTEPAQPSQPPKQEVPARTPAPPAQVPSVTAVAKVGPSGEWFTPPPHSAVA